MVARLQWDAMLLRASLICRGRRGTQGADALLSELEATDVLQAGSAAAEARMQDEVEQAELNMNTLGVCSLSQPSPAHTSSAGSPGREAARRSTVTIRTCGWEDRLLGRRVQETGVLGASYADGGM